MVRKYKLQDTDLQDHPELDHRVPHDIGCHDPVCSPILIELGERLRPRLPPRNVEEGQEGPVEDGEVIRCNAAEQDHPHHRPCSGRRISIVSAAAPTGSTTRIEV